MQNEILEKPQAVDDPPQDHRGPRFTSTKMVAFSAISVLLAATLWIAGDVLLLIFTGLLLAILLVNSRTRYTG